MSSSDSDIEPMYEVQKILCKRFNQQKPEYLIKWKGYVQKTWEPIQHLSNIPQMIFDFEEKEGSKRKIRKKIDPTFLQNSIKDEEQQNRKVEKKEHISKTTRKQNKINAKMNQRMTTTMKQITQKQNELKKTINQPQIIHNVNSSTLFSAKNRRIVDDMKASCRPYEQPVREGNIFHDIVKKVHQIKKMDGKWMVEVQFQSARFQKAWVERDMVRVLYPYELLVLYEEITKAKKYDLS